MATSPSETEFSKHVNTKFRGTIDGPNGQQEVELELEEVKAYPNKAEEHARMERFSLYFSGPADAYLPQGIYSLNHDAMGDSEIFLVPIAQDDRGFRYEAVFNYFKGD